MCSESNLWLSGKSIVLFKLYVNDLPSEFSSFCKLFADDAILYKGWHNIEDIQMIQNDIERLCQWDVKWLMFFKANMCKSKETP